MNRVTIPLDKLARLVAVWARLIPVGSLEPLTAEVAHEAHGSRTYSRLTVTRGDGKAVTVTKTQIGGMLEYGTREGTRHGTYVETLDMNGAAFWEDESEANYWAMGWAFAI